MALLNKSSKNITIVLLTLALILTLTWGINIQNKYKDSLAEIKNIQYIINESHLACPEDFCCQRCETISFEDLPTEAKNTLNQIKTGEGDSLINPHVYVNAPGYNKSSKKALLPFKKDIEHYINYYVGVEDKEDTGKTRLIIGKDGEIYYTNNHFQDFAKIIDMPYSIA